jgi:hypothetical protein
MGALSRWRFDVGVGTVTQQMQMQEDDLHSAYVVANLSCFLALADDVIYD